MFQRGTRPGHGPSGHTLGARDPRPCASKRRSGQSSCERQIRRLCLFPGWYIRRGVRRSWETAGHSTPARLPTSPPTLKPTRRALRRRPIHRLPAPRAMPPRPPETQRPSPPCGSGGDGCGPGFRGQGSRRRVAEEHTHSQAAPLHLLRPEREQAWHIEHDLSSSTSFAAARLRSNPQRDR